MYGSLSQSPSLYERLNEDYVFENAVIVATLAIKDRLQALSMYGDVERYRATEELERTLYNNGFIDKAIRTLSRHPFSRGESTARSRDTLSSYLTFFELLPSYRYVSIVREGRSPSITTLAVLLLPLPLRRFLLPPLPLAIAENDTAAYDFICDNDSYEIDEECINREIVYMMSDLRSYQRRLSECNLQRISRLESTYRKRATISSLASTTPKCLEMVIELMNRTVDVDDCDSVLGMTERGTVYLDCNGRHSSDASLAKYEVPVFQCLRTTIEMLLTRDYTSVDVPTTRTHTRSSLKFVGRPLPQIPGSKRLAYIPRTHFVVAIDKRARSVSVVGHASSMFGLCRRLTEEECKDARSLGFTVDERCVDSQSYRECIEVIFNAIDSD